MAILLNLLLPFFRPAAIFYIYIIFHIISILVDHQPAGFFKACLAYNASLYKRI